jgi:UDP-N-acetylmuramyl pentapeptide phosphotransferase/UDP-N-acetylglucosamine-1-phosphate transferase
MKQNIIFLIAGITSGWIITYISIVISNNFHIFDTPGNRSSHTIPTPRLGGTGIVLPVLAFFLIQFFVHDSLKQSRENILLTAILTGGSLCFITGLIDDLKGMKATVKLLLQCICAGLAVFSGLRINSIAGFSGLTLSPALGSIAAFCWILLMINAFNFMDGMNGKSGTFTAVAVFFIYLMLKGKNAGILPNALLLIMGASFSFLIFNVTPAKTFMGDSGSLFIGYLLAVIPLYLHSGDKIFYPFGSFVILLLPFLYDVIYTLIRRILKGENILKAHRTHLYQRLMIAGWGHDKILRLVFITYLLCGFLAIRFRDTFNISSRILICLLALFIMVIYTGFVIMKEKKMI